jgi:hypothetical protein
VRAHYGGPRSQQSTSSLLGLTGSFPEPELPSKRSENCSELSVFGLERRREEGREVLPLVQDRLVL